ncbi:type III-B CRISPR module RAMP protein Cmr4 [Actinocorallia sp. API 0066]|uniref:type III-B CRISPR module RAMP protein Cmr4 n=1 Tax=Actinocorallia sp. API 0066 TaxID=2896846 RepID=UPI001E5DE67C|nr:type III-B CRISPR module RAMP protein Cmr4 [Actinocorallia sp. API 0066]MCD0448603.1 type III-B CRISPR module RAMP protein Cmr4 [Actinocorallia sp. API 0066]
MSPPAEFLLYLYAESPLHPGASDSADSIDLPIQREAATTYPVIWGQSLKGALRQAAQESADWSDPLVREVFGKAVDAQRGEAEDAAGLLAVGDAQLVAMPVPTLRRTFAWVTSEIALGRLARKYRTLGHEPHAVPSVAADMGSAASDGWVDGRGQTLGPCVLPVEAKDANLAAWAALIAGGALSAAGFEPFRAKFGEDLLLVGSDAMPLLLRECTELTARVQLNEGKTVQNGPFYSEYLPTETLLAAPLTLRGGGADALKALRSLLGGELLRIGGDETLGKGLVWPRLVEAATR